MAISKPHTVKLATALGWQRKYDPGKTWLDIYEEEDAVCARCTLCAEFQTDLRSMRNFRASLISGISGSQLKVDTLRKHLETEQHRKAEQFKKFGKQRSAVDLYLHTPIGRALATAEDQHRLTVGKLMDILYTMAKEDIPIKKFSALAEQEKRHGVDLGSKYTNAVTGRELIMCIGRYLEEELFNVLKTTDAFSVLMDGSTDSGVIEKELVYVIYVNPQSGEVEVSFLKIKSVCDGRSEGLKKLLLEALNETGLSLKKMVGFGADGAAVNLGVKRGLAALLRQDIKWLVSVHCFSHRFELAVKDALDKTYFSDMSNMLMQLFYLYQKSPKRLRELRALGLAMEQSVQKPRKAHGTRWVQHKLLATQALNKSFPVVCAHLENMAADPSHDQAKAKGVLQLLTRFQMVCHLLFFEQMLQPLTRFSLALQKEVIEMPELISSISTLKMTLQTLRGETALVGSELDTLTSEANKLLSGTCESVSYRAVQLTHVSAQVLNSFKQQCKKYVTNIDKSCEDRLSFTEDSIYNCAKVLDTRLWPSELKELEKYGNNEIVRVAEHFSDLIVDSSFSVASPGTILSEWQEFKVFAQNNLCKLPPKEIWVKLATLYGTSYPQLVKLINILRVFPVSNAVVERCFSCMNKVKTDWRASLSEETVETLIRIKKQGPSPAEFKSKKAVDLFFSMKPRRPGVADDDLRPTSPKKNRSCTPSMSQDTDS